MRFSDNSGDILGIEVDNFLGFGLYWISERMAGMADIAERPTQREIVQRFAEEGRKRQEEAVKKNIEVMNDFNRRPAAVNLKRFAPSS
jgi:hypothetical protein